MRWLPPLLIAVLLAVPLSLLLRGASRPSQAIEAAMRATAPRVYCERPGALRLRH